MFAFNALNYELLIKDRISISNGVAFSFFSSSPEWYLGPWNITYYWLRCTNDKVTWDSDVRKTLLSSLQNIKIKGVKLNIQLLIWPSLLKKGNWTFFFFFEKLISAFGCVWPTADADCQKSKDAKNNDLLCIFDIREDNWYLFYQRHTT